MFEYEDHLHCPYCDGMTFSTDPEEAVIVTTDGVGVDLFECLTCGADGLYPTDLISGRVVPAGD